MTQVSEIRIPVSFDVAALVQGLTHLEFGSTEKRTFWTAAELSDALRELERLMESDQATTVWALFSYLSGAVPGRPDPDRISLSKETLWSLVFQLAGAATAGYWRRSGEVFREDEVSEAVYTVMKEFGFEDPPRGYKVRRPQEETDGDLLQRLGTDAEAWAAEFIRRHENQRLTADPGDVLHGWFANAIEAGRIAGEKASEPGSASSLTKMQLVVEVDEHLYASTKEFVLQRGGRVIEGVAR